MLGIDLDQIHHSLRTITMVPDRGRTVGGVGYRIR